ncbi:MAG: HAD family hydrolase [Anaerolineae bacterium]|nr:HAD family hydrolase [Anaerolineae bacterium]
MTPPIDTVLFDLNETLLTQIRDEPSHIAYTYAAVTRQCWQLTYPEFARAWEQVMADWDAHFSAGVAMLLAGQVEAARAHLVEPWYRDNIARIFAQLGIAAPNRWIEQVTWQYQDSWVGGLRLPAGNLAALEALRAAEFRLGLVTNFQQANIIPEILAMHGLDAFLPPEYTVISSAFGTRKPHPAIFAQALAQLGISGQPERAAYVGDNPVDDVQGAALAGLRPIIIGGKPLLPEHQDVPRIQALSELPGLLARLNGAG